MNLNEEYRSCASPNVSLQGVEINDFIHDHDPPSKSETEQLSDDHVQVMETNDNSLTDIKNKRKLRQTKRNLGQSYQTKSGKVIQKRKIEPLQQCKKGCSSKVSYEDQKHIFNLYWSQGEYIKRVNFVDNLLTIKQKQRLRLRTDEKFRKYTVEYHLNTESQSITVCKKCFLNTLGETGSFVKSVLNRRWSQADETPIYDHRGKHSPANKRSFVKINEIENYVEVEINGFNHDHEPPSKNESEQFSDNHDQVMETNDNPLTGVEINDFIPDHDPPSKSETEQLSDNHDQVMETNDNSLTDIKNKRKLRQTKRNLGQSYQTKSGKVIEKRTIEPLQQCKKGCSSKVSHEDQKHIFNLYWSQGEYIKRVNFVDNLLTIKQKQRLRQRTNEKFRKYTVEYHLNTESQSITVCKKCFLNTLGETGSFVQNVLNKRWSLMDETAICDQRGKHSPVNKSSFVKIKEIEDHIGKFPLYESYCFCSQTSKKYLPSELNISIMYNLYKQEISDPLSKNMYRKVFTKIGLKFKSSQIDTCNKCSQFTNLLEYELDVKTASKTKAEKEDQRNTELTYR